MKKAKLLLLLSVATLMACTHNTKSSSSVVIESSSSTTSEIISSSVNEQSSSEKSSSSTIVESSSSFPVSENSSNGTSSNKESSSTSEVISSSSNKISSSSQIQSSSSLLPSSSSSLAPSSSSQVSSNSSSSSEEALETTVTFNFFNPSCGSISTEVLNDRLANYMNEVAGSTLVSSVTNVKSQITNDIPNKGEKVLQIGASSSAGSIEFTFSETIKAVTITAQTYHKPYTNYQTGESVPNVDSYSELAISINGQEHTQTVDLKPTDGQPVETQYTTAINASKFKLASVNDEKGRVFIKRMIVIY